MFSFFSRKLTDLSNHYVDWTRVGELLASGRHRYSAYEIAVRGAVVAATAVSGFLGAHYNDEEKTHCSTTTAAIASAVLGFIVSHTIVIVPLIMKRYQMSQSCAKLVIAIQEKLSILNDMDTDTCKLISDTVANICVKSEIKASATWGMRKRLLNAVLVSISGNEADIYAVWYGNADDMIKRLDAGNMLPVNRP